MKAQCNGKKFYVGNSILTVMQKKWICENMGKTYTNASRAVSAPTNLFILELSTGCNLTCDYCYKKAAHLAGENINYDVAQNAVDWARYNLPGPLHILLSGGEPVLNEEVMKKIVTVNHDLKFFLQTNGLLMPQEMVNFIKQNSISVSISFDGLPFLHDRFRKTPDNHASSSRVLKTIARLLENNIVPAVIATVSSNTLPFVPDIIRFLENMGVNRISFSPLRDHPESITPYEYALVLLKAAEYLNSHPTSVKVRELVAWAHTLILQNPIECGCGLSCPAGESVFSVGPDGHLNNCSRLSNQTVMNDKNNHETLQEKTNKLFHQNEKCRSCCFKGFCSGECPALEENFLCDFLHLFAPSFIVKVCENKDLLLRLLDSPLQIQSMEQPS